MFRRNRIKSDFVATAPLTRPEQKLDLTIKNATPPQERMLRIFFLALKDQQKLYGEALAKDPSQPRSFQALMETERAAVKTASTKTPAYLLAHAGQHIRNILDDNLDQLVIFSPDIEAAAAVSPEELAYQDLRSSTAFETPGLQIFPLEISAAAVRARRARLGIYLASLTATVQPSPKPESADMLPLLLNV